MGFYTKGPPVSYVSVSAPGAQEVLKTREIKKILVHDALALKTFCSKCGPAAVEYYSALIRKGILTGCTVGDPGRGHCA